MTYRNGQYESSGFDNWMTPANFLDEITEEFGDYYDPCPRNPTEDGLSIDWPTNKAVFVNPPYSEIARWCEKCREQFDRGCTVLLLIPPRTDTRYFHDYIVDIAEVRFIKGRLKFVHPDGGKDKSAPFPSILCIMRSAKAMAD